MFGYVPLGKAVSIFAPKYILVVSLAAAVEVFFITALVFGLAHLLAVLGAGIV